MKIGHGYGPSALIPGSQKSPGSEKTPPRRQLQISARNGINLLELRPSKNTVTPLPQIITSGLIFFFVPPPPVGGIGSIQYTGSSNRGCARLGGGAVTPPLGVVKEKVTVLVVLVGRHCAVGAALRRAVDDEVPSAVEKKTGLAAVRRMPPGLLDAPPVHALGALRIVVVVRDVGTRQFVSDDVTDAAHVPRHLRERAHHEDQHLTPVVPFERGDHRPVGARRVAVEFIDPRCALEVVFML